MRRRGFHILLALGLALSVIAGTVITGGAQNNGQPNGDAGPSELMLPWVPNSAEIDDPRAEIGTTGPFTGAITVQNLEDEPVIVQFDVLATGESDTFEIDDGWASYTLTAAKLYNDSDVEGSGVVLSTTEGERIAAVQKQSSPTGPDDEARTGQEHEIVAGYTALTDADVGSDIILPIVQTNNFWNTLVRLTNFGDQAADVVITMHEAGGDGDPITVEPDEIPTGETLTVDLLGDEVVPAEWVGSARISANQPVGAVAERVKNLTDMLILNTSKFTEDGATQFAPLVFHDWNLWNTGISIANLADVANEVTIEYYSREGELAETDTMTVPANGMDYVYTPAAEANGFLGSAVISADHPVRGAVDEVKYFGDDPDTGHAMSYMVEDQAAVAGETLALPIFQSGDAQGGADTSGIQLFNPTEDWVAGAVRFITQWGIEYRAPLVVHLEPGEGYTVYQHDMPEFPPDVHGSALVQVYAGDGAITAASNNVNYDVMHDGSASFNLMLVGTVGPETPEHILRTDPRWATNTWGEIFSLTATLLDVDGNPVPEDDVLIMVSPSIEGPPGDARVLETDEYGQVVFNGEYTRGGDELVDRFIVIYPGFDPGEAWPEEPGIETYAWKTWVEE